MNINDKELLGVSAIERAHRQLFTRLDRIHLVDGGVYPTLGTDALEIRSSITLTIGSLIDKLHSEEKGTQYKLFSDEEFLPVYHKNPGCKFNL